MNFFKKIATSALLVFAIAVPSVSVQAQAATTSLTVTTPSGYTCADDVQYVKDGNYIANWGARGENCTFLSTYAQSFYTGSYTYSALENVAGGTGKSDAPNSDLYDSLQTLMTSKHTYKTGYDETNNLYRYTDCLLGNDSKISSFYSGTVFDSAWVSGGTVWNKEHTWPKSKETEKKAKEDIMMLRPTVTSENSARGNTAYGESSGYYNPNGEMSGQNPQGDLRGDCARIVLYVYVRWGNTSRMWGTSGVMESLPVLLKWMEEDPVDTWEMGRNDAVQSITGTRNVFVDYPEYAWRLFGATIPDDISTPSNGVYNGTGGSVSGGDSSSSGETDETTPIATICASAAGNYTAKGTAVAVNARSFLLQDETGSILVYKDYDWSGDVSVGDVVTVEGTTSSYGNAMQFGKEATYTKTGTETVSYPKAKTLTMADCEAYASGSVTPEYVKVNGTLSVTENSKYAGSYYYNLDVGSTTVKGSITYPTAEEHETLSALDGKEVTVTGYVTGLTNSKYVNIIMTDVKAYADEEDSSNDSSSSVDEDSSNDSSSSVDEDSSNDSSSSVDEDSSNDSSSSDTDSGDISGTESGSEIDGSDESDESGVDGKENSSVVDDSSIVSGTENDSANDVISVGDASGSDVLDGIANPFYDSCNGSIACLPVATLGLAALVVLKKKRK